MAIRSEDTIQRFRVGDRVCHQFHSSVSGLWRSRPGTVTGFQNWRVVVDWDDVVSRLSAENPDNLEFASVVDALAAVLR